MLLYVDNMLIVAKSKEGIRTIKAQLNNEFEMKDLGAAKKILRMDILRDRVASRLSLSHKGYIEKVFRRFNMQNTKPVTTSLVAHFRLSSSLCPQSDEEVDYMSRVPYSSVVGSLMYAWCALVQILPMQSVATWKNLTRNIGKQFSGSCDTCMDPVVFVCSLVAIEMELQGMLILIMLEISIRGYPLQDTCSPLEVVLLVGKLLFS